MLRIFGNTTLFAAAILAAACLGQFSTPRAAAQDLEDCPPEGVAGRRACMGRLHDQQNCRDRTFSQPELFYNYYVPGTCGGVPAEMYLAPQPVPALVGHTYFTYQPMMPHELLYQHHRTYYRHYDEGRGLTRTRVSWYRAPMTGVTQYLRIAR
jgi:hypothetical protein